MSYLHWHKQTITDFSDANITALYHEGYVFTRLGKGVIQQTRSLRVDLSRFELTSENRRILRKTDGLHAISYQLSAISYHWSIAKLAKDFYDTKFGAGTFSANKVKELLTDHKKSNFNLLLKYSNNSELRTPNKTLGYAICYENSEILHYAYPFYELRTPNSELTNVGLGMMLRAILYAQERGKRYVYLGSFQRSTDVYKLQFEGLEWFDGTRWSLDLNTLKECL